MGASGMQFQLALGKKMSVLLAFLSEIKLGLRSMLPGLEPQASLMALLYMFSSSRVPFNPVVLIGYL